MRLSILIPFAIVTLIWGSTWLVILGQLGTVPPSWSVAYRFAIAGVAMLAWAAYRGELARLDAWGWILAALTGLTQFALNFNFIYRAEHFMTSGLVAVVFSLLLVPNALFARIFLGQRMGRQLLVGSLVAVVGVTLLFLHELRDDPGNTAGLMAGIGFTVAALLSASASNILQGTELAKRYPMVSTLGVAMLIGAALDGAYAWATAGPPVFDPRPDYWLGMLYLGVVASAITFPLYFGVLRVIGPAKASYSGVIVPVIAMLLSTLFEGYRWSSLAAGGALVTIAGLIIALSARRPNR